MKYFYLLTFIVLILSCKSPSQLLEEGKYNSAFKKAVFEVKKGKNVEENTNVIQTTAQMKVDKALSYTSMMTNTGEVSDLIKSQSKVYVLLKDLGKANNILNGLISEPYDALCNEKKDIDYQVVEYFYDEGHDHLDRFYDQENKIDARHAFESFKKCEKYEGQDFFPVLAENIEDAYQNGIVYYVSDYGRIGSKQFLKPLPEDANFKPDCDISIHHGHVSFTSSETSTNDTETKEIETGQESIKDTSGNVTFKPIFETISATVTETTITITASVTTKISSEDVTGQCSLSSSYFTTELSESYVEVTVSGDTRALTHHVSTEEGEPSFFKRNLEDKLLDKADDQIGI